MKTEVAAVFATNDRLMACACGPAEDRSATRAERSGLTFRRTANACMPPRIFVKNRACNRLFQSLVFIANDRRAALRNGNARFGPPSGGQCMQRVIDQHSDSESARINGLLRPGRGCDTPRCRRSGSIRHPRGRLSTLLSRTCRNRSARVAGVRTAPSPRSRPRRRHAAKDDG